MKKKIAILQGFTIALFLFSLVMGYKGYDKMTNYYSSDYDRLNKNAYVGGDAYNYIINGTYATSYFVLAAGALISGVICLTGSFVLSSGEEPDTEKTKDTSQELPTL